MPMFIIREAGEKEWQSSERAQLSPLWPGFDFRTWCHMRVELVDDFLACSESSSTVPPVLLSLQNLNSKIQFDLEPCDEYLPCAYPPLKAIEVV